VVSGRPSTTQSALQSLHPTTAYIPAVGTVAD